MSWAIVVLALGVGAVVGLSCVGMVWVSNAAQRIAARTAIEIMAEEDEVQWPDCEL